MVVSPRISFEISVTKLPYIEEMNIAPTDASKAPYAASGELFDRMQGNLHGGDGRFEDLKKRSSCASSPGSTSGSDMRKKSLSVKKEVYTPRNTDKYKSEEAEAEETAVGDEKPAAKKRRARKKWKKPRDKPNRPLSAYNLFFQKERALMLGDKADKGETEKGKKRVHRKTHGKIGFADMARVIGAKWKTLADKEKAEFEEVAAKEKTRYAEDLAVWKEEQKKKEEAARKIAKSATKGLFTKDDDAGEDVGGTGLTSEQQLQLRMQMMTSNTRTGFSLLGGDAYQRQMPTIDYLRAMQEGRGSMFGGGSFVGNSSAQQFPNASEASANALLTQFQAMPQGGAGMDGSGSGSMSDYQHLQMARMQMMNSSMMGGQMGGGMMGGGMSMGSSFPPVSDLEFQRLQQIRMMQGMNQMDGSNSGMSGSNNTQQGSTSAEMMRRFQNRFGGM